MYRYLTAIIDNILTYLAMQKMLENKRFSYLIEFCNAPFWNLTGGPLFRRDVRLLSNIQISKDLGQNI